MRDDEVEVRELLDYDDVDFECDEIDGVEVIAVIDKR